MLKHVLLFIPLTLLTGILFPSLALWVSLERTAAFAADLRPEEIITVLPKDRIPAILSPSFGKGDQASWLKGEDAVIGVEMNGESHAYPVAILSSREIVNDKVGGIPIAVTW